MTPRPKLGSEKFAVTGKSLDFTLSNFWQWSASDLAVDHIREPLSEFIVLKSLGISTDGIRNASVFRTKTGIPIEVFSRVFIPGLKPILDVISFGRSENVLAARRIERRAIGADGTVFIFAVIAPPDADSLDLMDLNQWMFFVLNQQSLMDWKRAWINVHLLRTIGGPFTFSQLSVAVADCALIARFTRLTTEGLNATLEVAQASPIGSPPSERWTSFRTWPSAPSRLLLWETQMAALNDPTFFAICSSCGSRTHRGGMTDCSICIRCETK